MPRFFFDFCQGTDRCPDAEGSDFPDVERAYLEAHEAAGDMWSELLKQRRDPRLCAFEVRDGKRQLLFTLPFQEVLDSCHDRTPPQRHFKHITASVHRAKRANEDFLTELRRTRVVLEQSRELLARKV